MRSLKFRVWDTEEKKWRNEMILCDSNGELHIQDHMVIMQFTGLLDREGKEIWEGDVVRSPMGGKWEIKWRYGGYIPCNGSVWGDTAWWQDCEVLGNIYEHPHLLDTPNA